MRKDDYASHLPVLQTLLCTLRPRRVLEFGAGDHSTPAILESSDVECLVSVEVDNEWREKVALACPDYRLTLIETRPRSVDTFDLILIDDGQHTHQREATIRIVLAHAHPLVVIHDADVPEYAAAIDELSSDYSVIPTDPPTAIVAARKATK